MKRFIDICIIATIAILILASIADAQRPSRLSRPCPGTTTPATVDISRFGNITFSPCSTATVSASRTIVPTNTGTSFIYGSLNLFTFDGSSASGSTNITGNDTRLVSTAGWIAPPLNAVSAGAFRIDIGAQNGFDTLTGLYGSARIGSVNAGSGNAVYGVRGVAAYGYASTIPDIAAVIGTLQGVQGGFGGTATHVAALQAHSLSTDVNITNLYGLRVGPYSGSATGTITNNYGIFIDSTTDDTGTNRWAIYSQATAPSFLSGKLSFDATYTAGGTTGNQTINKPAFSVNFAAAASSLTVTNSFVTAASMLLCTCQTNDGTMKSVAAVAGSGSVVLHANAAATAETKVYCEVRN